jgi:hypothetical protein
MLERIVGLAVIVAAGIYLSMALALPYGTTARPGAGFFTTLTARAFRVPARQPAAREGVRDAAAQRRAVSTVGVLVAFCLLMPWVGYPLVAFGFVTVLLQRLGSTWRAAAVTGALTAAVSFYVFGVLLDVPLPRGPW